MKFHTQHERSTFDNILPSAAMGSTEEAGAQPQLHQIPPGSVHLRLQLPQLAHHRPEHRHHQPRRERPGQLHGAALLPASGRAGFGFRPRASPTRPPLTHPGRAPRSAGHHRPQGVGWGLDPRPTHPAHRGGGVFWGRYCSTVVQSCFFSRSPGDPQCALKGNGTELEAEPGVEKGGERNRGGTSGLNVVVKPDSSKTEVVDPFDNSAFNSCRRRRRIEAERHRGWAFRPSNSALVCGPWTGASNPGFSLAAPTEPGHTTVTTQSL